VYEETLTGWPHDASVQKATSDNENADAVQRHDHLLWGIEPQTSAHTSEHASNRLTPQQIELVRSTHYCVSYRPDAS